MKRTRKEGWSFFSISRQCTHFLHDWWFTVYSKWFFLNMLKILFHLEILFFSITSSQRGYQCHDHVVHFWLMQVSDDVDVPDQWGWYVGHAKTKVILMGTLPLLLGLKASADPLNNRTNIQLLYWIWKKIRDAETEAVSCLERQNWITEHSETANCLASSSRPLIRMVTPRTWYNRLLFKISHCT